MYRNMRRSDRQISREEAMEILRNGEYGFLATVGGDNQPYAVPLSYIVIENEIFFHCALSGQKLDNIAHEEKVCFSVAGETQPVYDNNFTTYFESAVVFGKARIIEDLDMKKEVLLKLAEKYLPEYMNMADKAIDGSMTKTAVCAVTIDHITGKAKKKKI